MRQHRVLLAAAVAAARGLAARSPSKAPAQEVGVEPVVTVGGPTKQHLPHALRLLVTSTDYAPVTVRADVPGLRFRGNDVVFKTEVHFDGPGQQRVQLRLAPATFRYLKRHLPRAGVTLRPTAAVSYPAGTGGVATPIQLVP